MILYFYTSKILRIFFQSILNFFFFIIFLFNPRAKKILEIKKNFKNLEIENRIKYKKQSQVIFEMFNINENIITFFVWSIYFKNKNKKILCYPVRIDSYYNPITYYIYKYLGFELLDYNLNKEQNIKLEVQLNKINFKTLNKKKLLNLKINNIPIGDLIYDHYLRYFQKPTVDLHSKELFLLIKNSIKILIYWDDYFKKNDVSDFCFSHSAYLLGLPGRVAIFNGINSMCISGNSVFKFNKKNLFLGDQFKNSNKILSKFYKRVGLKNKNKIISDNKKDLKNIFSGKKSNYFGILPSSQKNTFRKLKNSNYQKKSKKFKILIAAHDFFEGPNLWGKFVFPDFYEWIKYLIYYVGIDKKKNREWFLKLHPDASKDQIDIFKELLRDNNNIKILPSKTTHRELINKKINYVLSARGSIGYQYAYFGINTLYCSKIGLYKNFNFISKSNTLPEYKKKLDNMENISKKKINFNGILKFIILLNIFVYKNKSEFILPNIDHLTKNKKLFLFQAKSEKYNIETLDYVQKHLSNKQIKNIFYLIDNFLNNKNNLVIDTFQV